MDMWKVDVKRVSVETVQVEIEAGSEEEAVEMIGLRLDTYGPEPGEEWDPGENGDVDVQIGAWRAISASRAG